MSILTFIGKKKPNTLMLGLSKDTILRGVL
jgi:hypothetical protein